MIRTGGSAVFLRILAIVLSLAAGSAQAALVGLYTFNDGNGNDSSGNGNHATAIGADVSFLGAGGPDGDGSASFSGVAGSFINVPVDINFSSIPQLTMGAWVRPSVVGNTVGKILSHDNGQFDRTLGFDTRGGGPGISMFTGSGVAGNEVVAINEWHFVAVRYDGTNARLNVNAAQLSVADNSSDNAGEVFTQIGGNPNFPEFFSGEIDNVFFFDEALSDAELENIRVNGISAVPLPAALLLVLSGLPLLRARRG